MRISDWSSDVCSSDLYILHQPDEPRADRAVGPARGGCRLRLRTCRVDGQEREFPCSQPHGEGVRKSVVSGKSVSVRVDHGGCRIIKKKSVYQYTCALPTIHSYQLLLRLLTSLQ